MRLLYNPRMQTRDHDQDKPDWVTDNLPRVLKGVGTAALVLALAAICSYVWRFHDVPVAADTGAWGEFGDFFGGVLNPAFSFLTLVGLLMTLHVQSKELQESRLMAAEAQKEAKNSADALKAQNEAIHHQRFEQTFFAWLESYRSLIQGITYRPRHSSFAKTPTIEYKGLEAIHRAGYYLTTPSLVNKLPADDAGKRPTLETLTHVQEELLIEAFIQERREFFAEGVGGHLVAPISTAEQLLAWVAAQSSLQEEAKAHYVRIFRAQLSQTEQQLLVIAILGLEWNNLRLLVERYNFLEPGRFSADPSLTFLWEQRNRIIMKTTYAEPSLIEF